MITARNLARNVVLHFLPPKVAHRVNVYKNIKRSYLEPEMGVLDLVTAGPEGVAIDVGANLGLYCELLSERFASVLAVEPQSWLAAYLRRIVPANVRIVEAVASAAPGQIELRIPRMAKGLGKLFRLDALASAEQTWSGNDGVEFDAVPVRAETLDALAADLPRVDFIKIDVEGHELAVVQGAVRLISMQRPLFMIEIERRHNPRAAEVFDTLAAAGYRAFCLEASKRFRPVSGATLADVQTEEGAKRHAEGAGAHDSGYLFNFFFVHEADPRLAGFTR